MMLAGISHDLRTPLARLRIAAEMLPTRASELCNGMVQDIEELDAIIGQFLSYVRDGSDEVALWVRLDDVIRSAVEPLRRESDCIELHLAEMPPMHLRPLAIQRLITNLVTNATTHGKPPVRVDCGFRGGTPFLAVRDHGSGIDPDRFDELLRPFSRGDHARSTQGSGLGLAIVARIARVHRAEVLPERRADGFAVRVHFPASIGENLG